jgi:hypothetical protein
MSLRAENPRNVRLSPWAPPPSPAAMLTPVTLRRASRRLKADCSRMTSSGMTVIDCGVSWSESGSFELVDSSTL